MSETQTVQEQELAAMLVETLNLEDVVAEEIAPEAPLFGHDPDSLGLDSIDALEIAQAIAQKFQVQIRADDEQNKAIFRSLRSLSEYVVSQQ
ncbi:MAG: phosphopantetheine-binding protein [Oceanococcus sp.]